MTRPTLPSRRFALRHRTAAAHAALDAAVGALDSRAAYRRYLAGLYAFRQPVEAAIVAAPLPEGLGPWRPSLVAGCLAADARDLGVDLAPPASARVPAQPSGLLGLLYVLEGSALGARLLVRHAANLGLDAGFGARHLAAQTASPAPWRGFCALLEAWPDFDPEAAAEAATAAFASALAGFADKVDAAG